MTLLETVRQALLLNELDGQQAAAYRFSNASERSGLSFGITQLDVSHNSAAVECLLACDFTWAEIAELKRKAGDWKGELSAKLAGHKPIVDRFDSAQVKECLDHVMNVARSRRIRFADDPAIVHLADYHNQFYLATTGKMSNSLAALERPVTAKDILAVKLDTAWGKTEKGKADVMRRYNNIVKITSALP